MSMLAERKRKQKWSLNPNGMNWTEDSNKFGQKMLEKMGWRSGKGLGAHENGITEHIKVSHKCDSKGVGFKENSEQWTEHEDNFATLLKSLNGNTETRTDELKLNSLERMAETTRSRITYRKFTRGKDLSRYSAKDLANIFGKKDLETSRKEFETKDEEPPRVDEEKVDKSHPESDFLLNRGSMRDYFKSKLPKGSFQTNGYKVGSNGVLEMNNSDESECERYVGFGFNPCKGEKSSGNDESVELEVKDIKQTKTKHNKILNGDGDDSLRFIDESFEDDNVKSDKIDRTAESSGKKKKKVKEVEANRENDDELCRSVESNEEKESPKKKKKKKQEKTEEIIEIDEPKKKTSKLVDDSLKESSVDVDINPKEGNSIKTAKKKSKKSKKRETKEENEERNAGEGAKKRPREDEDDGEAPKKKSKRNKSLSEKLMGKIEDILHLHDGRSEETPKNGNLDGEVAGGISNPAFDPTGNRVTVERHVLNTIAESDEERPDEEPIARVEGPSGETKPKKKKKRKLDRNEGVENPNFDGVDTVEETDRKDTKKKKKKKKTEDFVYENENFNDLNDTVESTRTPKRRKSVRFSDVHEQVTIPNNYMMQRNELFDINTEVVERSINEKETADGISNEAFDIRSIDSISFFEKSVEVTAEPRRGRDGTARNGFVNNAFDCVDSVSFFGRSSEAEADGVDNACFDRRATIMEEKVRRLKDTIDGVEAEVDNDLNEMRSAVDVGTVDGMLSEVSDGHRQMPNGVRLGYRNVKFVQDKFSARKDEKQPLPKKSYKHLIKGDIVLAFRNTNLHRIHGYGAKVK